jgi:hypothetical protein
MTRPNDSSGNEAAKWWNEKSQEEFEKLEFLEKQMKRAMEKPEVTPEDDEEDMGPPDLPEDDEMSPPDLPEDDDEMAPEDDDEMALEPTEREMDMQDRMTARRDMANRRPKARRRAEGMMKSGEPRDVMSKALKAEMELKRAFSPEKRRDLAKSGLALPDGSFPIVTTSDLKNAIMAFGRAKKKNKAAAKRHIIKRARALKKDDLIPETWGKKDAKGYGMPMGPMSDPMMPMPKKKKKMSYGEKEEDMAEMEDDEMAAPMSREELMKRLFDKKKKKPAVEAPAEEGEEAEETE